MSICTTIMHFCSANSDQQAQIALNSLFSLFYLLLFGFGIAVLVVVPMLRNRIYFTLLLTLLFQSMSTIFSVFSTVLGNGGLMQLTDASYGPTNIAFLALIDFFSYWSYALLFLCICLLVHERHLAMQSLSSIIPTIYYTLFALLMVFGITATGISINYIRLADNRASFIGLTPAEIDHKASLSLDLGYTFNSIWYFASACLVGYVVYVQQQMRRYPFNDKVRSLCHFRTERLTKGCRSKAMWFILVIIIPLYIFLNVESIVFTIINSSSGIKVKHNLVADLHQSERDQIAENVLSNIFFIAVSGAILALGLSCGRWNTGSARKLHFIISCECILEADDHDQHLCTSFRRRKVKSLAQ